MEGSFVTGLYIGALAWGVLWGITCAIMASNKNRSRVGWFVLGFCLSFFAAIWIAVLRPIGEEEAEISRKHGSIVPAVLFVVLIVGVVGSMAWYLLRP